MQLCSICHREDETIEHLLWDSNHVQVFLGMFEHYLEAKKNKFLLDLTKYMYQLF